MKEKDTKEILTRDKIEFDLQKRIESEQRRKSNNAINNLFEYAVKFSVWALLLGGVCFLFEANAADSAYIKYSLVGAILIAVGIVVLVIGLIPTLIYNHRKKNELNAKLQFIKAHKYRIVCDTLERAGHDEYIYFPNDPFFKGGTDLLKFAHCGEYCIPSITHYTWSKDYYLSPDGMFNTSIVGDTFYLVILTSDPNQKIAMIYNTKFFKLQDDDLFDYEELS